jgi:hypothetical protein
VRWRANIFFSGYCVDLMTRHTLLVAYIPTSLGPDVMMRDGSNLISSRCHLWSA